MSQLTGFCKHLGPAVVRRVRNTGRNGAGIGLPPGTPCARGGCLEVHTTMRDLNKVFLVGRLGGDPVRSETKSGLAVTSFSLATSKRVQVEGGEEPVQKTVWHRIVSWGREAENSALYLKKGALVLVEGTLKSHDYVNAEGQSRSRMEVHADQVTFLTRAQSRGSEVASA
jgi:single-strand DNA-binding protein